MLSYEEWLKAISEYHPDWAELDSDYLYWAYKIMPQKFFATDYVSQEATYLVVALTSLAFEAGRESEKHRLGYDW